MLLVLSLLGCSAPTDTEETLKKEGFTDIQVGGYSWFGCRNDDDFATNFTARNPQGEVVSGACCCNGWIFRRCVLRW